MDRQIGAQISKCKHTHIYMWKGAGVYCQNSTHVLISLVKSVRSVFLSSFSSFFLNTETTLSFVSELELKGKLFQLLTLEQTSRLHPIQTGLNETLPGCVTSCD